MKKTLITFTQKDIEKNRLTTDNLKLVIDYMGDTTWFQCDYSDTVDRVEQGEVVAIAFTRYDNVPDKSMFLTHSNKNGEYTDVTADYINEYRNMDLVEVPFKTILKTILKNYIVEDVENVPM